MERSHAVSALTGMGREIMLRAEKACALHGIPQDTGITEAADLYGPLSEAGYGELLSTLGFLHEREYAVSWSLRNGRDVHLGGTPDTGDAARLAAVVTGEVTAVLHLSPMAQNIALKAQWGSLSSLEPATRAQRTAGILYSLAAGVLRITDDTLAKKDLRRSIFHRSSLYAALSGTGHAGVLACNRYLAQERGPVAGETLDGLRDRLSLIESQATTPAIRELWTMIP